jgi:hypothetical protein|nr:MAG TPA: Pyocin activator protein PrtN [Caudoviricetes sp.]
MEDKKEKPTKLKTDKSILSMDEVKGYLGIGNTTLNDWRTKGLKCYRINNRLFYMLEDIKEFMRGFEV